MIGFAKLIISDVLSRLVFAKNKASSVTPKPLKERKYLIASVVVMALLMNFEDIKTALPEEAQDVAWLMLKIINDVLMGL